MQFSIHLRKKEYQFIPIKCMSKWQYIVIPLASDSNIRFSMPCKLIVMSKHSMILALQDHGHLHVHRSLGLNLQTLTLSCIRSKSRVGKYLIYIAYQTVETVYGLTWLERPTNVPEYPPVALGSDAIMYPKDSDEENYIWSPLPLWSISYG